MPTELYVGNLPNECSEETLRGAFAPYGSIGYVAIMKNYAFVHFFNDDEAAEAVKGLYGTTIADKSIEVQISRSKGEGGALRDNQNKQGYRSNRGKQGGKKQGGKTSENRRWHPYPGKKRSRDQENRGGTKWRKNRSARTVRKALAGGHRVPQGGQQQQQQQQHQQQQQPQGGLLEGLGGLLSAVNTLETMAQKMKNQIEQTAQHLQHQQQQQQQQQQQHQQQLQHQQQQQQQQQHLQHQQQQHQQQLQHQQHQQQLPRPQQQQQPLPSDHLPHADVRVRREVVHTSDVPNAHAMGLSKGYVIHETYYVVSPNHPMLEGLPLTTFPDINNNNNNNNKSET